MLQSLSSNIQKAKVVGDYLHTASMLDSNFHVISAVNSPNCYEGPMTGYPDQPRAVDKTQQYSYSC